MATITESMSTELGSSEHGETSKTGNPGAKLWVPYHAFTLVRVPGPDMLRLIEHRDQSRAGLAQVEAARLRSCSGPKMEMESALVEIPTSNCLLHRRQDHRLG